MLLLRLLARDVALADVPALVHDAPAPWHDDAPALVDDAPAPKHDDDVERA